MKSQTIKHFIEEYFEISLSEDSRKREFVCPRMIYYKLCSLYCEETLNKIGETVGKDHTTVLAGMKRFELSYNQQFFRHYAVDYLELKESVDKVSKFKSFTNVQTIEDVKNEYKVKLFELGFKHQKELQLLRKTLGPKPEIVEKVFKMDEKTIDEFTRLADVFYKRKMNELKYA